MKKTIYLHFLFFFLCSCNDQEEITLVVENSSSQPMSLIISRNKIILDSIKIEPIEKQRVQVSERRRIKVSNGDVLNFVESNSGKTFNRKFKCPCPEKSFVILGLGKNSVFYMDTISYDYDLPNI